MATFNLAIADQGASKSLKPRLRSSNFGDGYEQRVADGINNLLETWSLGFTGRTRSLVLSMDSFFKIHGGYQVFDWVTPEGVTSKFVCQEWSIAYTHDGDASLTCKFEQKPA